MLAPKPRKVGTLESTLCNGCLDWGDPSQFSLLFLVSHLFYSLKWWMELKDSTHWPLNTSYIFGVFVCLQHLLVFFFMWAMTTLGFGIWEPLKQLLFLGFKGHCSWNGRGSCAMTFGSIRMLQRVVLGCQHGCWRWRFHELCRLFFNALRIVVVTCLNFAIFGKFAT